MLAIAMVLPVTIAFSTPTLALFNRIGAMGRRLCRFRTSGVSCKLEVKESCDKLTEKLRTISHLEGIMGLLGWDEQVMMPAGAETARGKQKAALALTIHEAKIDEEIGKLIRTIESSGAQLDEVMQANLREAKLRFERNRRMPSSLASRAAELETTAYGIWVKAREQSDFAMFAPVLNETIELRKQICRITKPDMDLYDAAIDSFDPRMTAKRITEIFDEVKVHLPPLIRRINERVAERPDLQVFVEHPSFYCCPVVLRSAGVSSIVIFTHPTAPMRPQEIPAALRGGPEWDPERQAAMCREIAAALGFDSERGRMDVSIHPFTGGSHPTDVRITTRYSADNWLEGLAGTIHECGHAMYEQGRPAGPAAGDLPAGEALGMAVHESQSLLWERMVAQGLPFWRWAAPVVHRHFPHTQGCSPEDFYRAVNLVRPSLIRVDADEVRPRPGPG